MDQIQIEYQNIQIINLDEIKQLTLIEKTHSETVTIQLVEYHKQFIVQKSILKTSLQTQKQLEHLQNEIIALTKLDYPSINKIVGITNKNDYIHLFVQFEKGIPLHKLLRNAGSINQKFATFFFIQIVLTFQYLHEQGWIYRDLKASNIIINNEFQVKLVDLGLSKKISKHRTSSFCGTKHALPPEIFSKKEYEYDYSFDIYTLGIIYYEMLTGLPPFGLQNDGLVEKIKKGIGQEQLKKLKDPLISEAVASMLSLNPDLRPNCKEILKLKCFENLNIDGIKDFIFDSAKKPNEYYSDYYEEEIYLYCTQFSFEDEQEQSDDNDLKI